MKSTALFAISLFFFGTAVASAHTSIRPPSQPSPANVESNSGTVDTDPSRSAQESGEGADTSRPKSVAETYETRADILMARKEFPDAKVLYQKALDLQPKNPQVLNKMGIACQQLGDAQDAERYYKKSIRANKAYYNAVNNLGTLEYTRKRFGKAISYYKRAIQISPGEATVYSNLAYAYYGNNQYPEAVAAFGKAMALDPSVFEAKNGGGTVIQQRGADNPALFFFLLAKSYAKAGNAERAAHYLKIARDDGYKDYRSAQKDPAFAAVIKDERVQQVLQLEPSYAAQPDKTPSSAAQPDKTTPN